MRESTEVDFLGEKKNDSDTSSKREVPSKYYTLNVNH